MGRKSTFDEKIATKIVDRLSQGEPMTVICRDAAMPTDRTVRNWIAANETFASDIARARELGFDAIAAECLTIADDVEGEPQRDRLRVETRLKLLAKWDPKRYGDKMAVTGGGEGDPPIRSELKVSFV
jgi:hypothetical protein